MLKRLAPPALCVILAAAAAAQEAGRQARDARAPSPAKPASNAAASDGLYRELLQLPAPTPLNTVSDVEEPAGNSADEEKPPPDDAPTADLISYWSRWANSSRFDDADVSDAVRRRLLEACEADPRLLPRLTFALPDSPQDSERVKKLYDAAQGSGSFDETWSMPVREWLKFHSPYFSSELLEEARKAADREGYVAGQSELKALAKFDWETAEPLLHTLAGSGQIRAAVLAVALMRRHALEEKDSPAEEHLRARLQAFASDPNAPAHARHTAVEELSATEWPGRDEWYLSLFSDETLLRPVDGNTLFHPLTVLFDRDPDRWIPLMTKLVESRDAAVRHNAALCLANHALAHPRRDAILPLLPWLYDPDWLPAHETEFTWFLGRLDRVEVPEAVPGLIWIVEHDENNAQYAANTLAHYRVPRAVPALRRALERETGEDGRENILEGLEASGGLGEDEQLAGLEAYAAKTAAESARQEPARPRGDDDDDGPTPLPVSVGRYLSKKPEVPDSLSRAALARVETLRRKNPARARVLLGIVEGWQTRQVELDMLRRVGEGAADASTVTTALDRRAKMRERVKPELYTLAGGGGAAQGFAAVLLGDEALARAVLESKDASARVALLACARLAQMPLALAQVGPLLRSRSELLALAAERYLLAEDSAEARALLWARHPGEAFVTGWRENVPLIGGSDFSAMGRAEEKLRAELFGKEDAPVEIIALMGNSDRPSHAVRFYADRAVFTSYEDDSRYRERTVTTEEAERFKNLLAESGVFDSGPRFGSCHYNCWVSELLSLRREGGRRVFTHQGFELSMPLVTNFNALGREDMRVRYNLEGDVKGFELLFADAALEAEAVWQKDGDLRVRVRRVVPVIEQVRDIMEANAWNDGSDGNAVENAALARERLRQRRLERARDDVSWRAFASGKLGATAARPELFKTPDWAELDLDENEFPPGINNNFEKAAVGDAYLIANGSDAGGLWKKTLGGKAVRVGGEGSYAEPVVTPDGAWAVASKAAESDWSAPNFVVRFDLKTGREYRVDIPRAEQFDALAYVAAHGKVLLRRASDGDEVQTESDGPDVPEFYLLDAATGRTQQVSGFFEPLMQDGMRPLQPTGRPDEFWAAVPDEQKNETRVGRYNTRDFSFRASLTVPHIQFDSFHMWADEASSKLLVVYKGQLMRLPLGDAPREK